MTWTGPGQDAGGSGRLPDDEATAPWPPEATPPTEPPGPPPHPAEPSGQLPPPPGMSWAPPPRYEPLGVPGVPGLQYAPVLPRFVAWLVDSFILTLIGLPIAWVASLLILGSMDWSSMLSAGYWGSGSVDVAEGMVGRVVVVGLLVTTAVTVIDAAYFVLQWAGDARATLGMRLLNLQIGQAADGRTLTREAALRRWFAMGSWVSLLGVIPVLGGLASLGVFVWHLVLLVTTASSPTKQGLHDQFAGSAIVRPVGASDNGMVIGCLLVLAVLVGLFVISIVALIFLGGQVSEILSDVGTSI